MIEDWEYQAENALQISKVHCLFYLDGLKKGIEMFAWWKEGTEFLGSGIYTKKEIFKQIEKWAKSKNINFN